MEIEDVQELYSGDEVYWNDPADGECSRIYEIGTIKIVGDIVTITENNGSCLECFAHELS